MLTELFPAIDRKEAPREPLPCFGLSLMWWDHLHHSRGHSTPLVGSSDCWKDRYIFNSCVGIYLVMTSHPWLSPDNKGHVASVFHLTGLQFDNFPSWTPHCFLWADRRQGATPTPPRPCTPQETCVGSRHFVQQGVKTVLSISACQHYVFASSFFFFLWTISDLFKES